MLDSMAVLGDLHQTFHQLLFSVLLCSARLFGVFGILHATGPQLLQGRARSGFVVLIAFFIGAGQPADMLTQFAGADLLILSIKEAFLGLLIGYAATNVFWVAEGVGALIDNVAGYNNVQQTNPLSNSQSTPISGLLLQLCVTVFYMVGGFLFLLGALFETYRWWPIASFMPVPAAMLERFILLQTDSLMTQILKISAPVLVVMVLIDLGFGLVAKTAGKLEPNALAQPVKSAVAVLVVLLSLSVFIDQLSQSLSLQDLQQQLRGWAEISDKPGAR
jgi:type III secretion protein T